MSERLHLQLARIYERQRAQNERERDERLNEAVRLDPSIQALQDELRRRFALSTREMLADRVRSPQLVHALKADVTRTQAQIGDKLQALGLPRDHLELRYACGLCKDTGFVGELYQRPCVCYRRLKAQLMRERAGLSGAEAQTFERFDPSIFPSDEQRTQAENARDACARFADTIGIPGGKLNLMLVGESGLGKTFLLCALAERAIERGVPALPVSAFNMLSAMREYHFGQTSDSGLLSQMIQCELLLIDDLGTEPMLRNITIEYLFMLLNERISHHGHTVIATNLEPLALRERYGERVASRLMDRSLGEFIRLSGQDLRYRVK